MATNVQDEDAVAVVNIPVEYVAATSSDPIDDNESAIAIVLDVFEEFDKDISLMLMLISGDPIASISAGTTIGTKTK